MRDDKFLAELLQRLQQSDSDGIINTTETGIVTDSESTRDAVLCVMELLELDKFVSVTERLDGAALEYHITFDAEASQPEWSHADGKNYQVVFMCGDYECDRQGYDNAHDACITAVSWDTDEGCDYAEVLRLNDAGDYEQILWCNTSCDFENCLDEDDPDYETVEEAFEWGNYGP